MRIGTSRDGEQAQKVSKSKPVSFILKWRVENYPNYICQSQLLRTLLCLLCCKFLYCVKFNVSECVLFLIKNIKFLQSPYMSDRTSVQFFFARLSPSSKNQQFKDIRIFSIFSFLLIRNNKNMASRFCYFRPSVRTTFSISVLTIRLKIVLKILRHRLILYLFCSSLVRFFNCLPICLSIRFIFRSNSPFFKKIQKNNQGRGKNFQLKIKMLKFCSKVHQDRLIKLVYFPNLAK